MDETWDVVVVGGGIAGLAAAASAAGNGRSVLLLDGQRGGGRGATDQVGRFKFNRGAHAFYRGTPGRDVLDRLGVKVVGSPPPTKGSLGRVGDEVGLLPVGAGSGLRTSILGPKDKLASAKVFAGIRRWKPANHATQTGTEWLDDLGLEGRIRQVIEAFCRLSSYVADFDTVSADLLAEMLQRAYVHSVEYLQGGWVTLVDGLADAARRRGATVEAGGHRVHAVIPEGRRVRVELDDRTLLARRVVLAAGSPDANATLLPERPAAWSGLGPPARAACLDVGLATVPEVAFLLGIDRPLYLSRHSPATDLSPAGTSVYGVMRYLRADEDLSPEDARRELEEHCAVAGIDAGDAEQARYLHRMVVCPALPTPETGGMQGRPAVRTEVSGLLVAGDWVGPVGHLVDAALSSGEAAGHRAIGELADEPAVHSAA